MNPARQIFQLEGPAGAYYLELPLADWPGLLRRCPECWAAYSAIEERCWPCQRLGERGERVAGVAWGKYPGLFRINEVEISVWRAGGLWYFSSDLLCAASANRRFYGPYALYGTALASAVFHVLNRKEG